jgi:pimeloyl-ACP methyl ester carboxylesterase
VVADGAGGGPGASRALAAAVREASAPLYVQQFAWTHGAGHGIRDMTDVAHARAQGRLLAEEVARQRSARPDLPVYLVGYSAGTHVVLEAARWLGPDSVERIVLLAPAVSADYDLCPALRAARQGVDVFTSERDRFYLGLGTRVVETADGKRGVPAAGRVGFDPPATADACLAARLRQYPWSAEVAATGNRGEHSGSLQPTYLRAFVLPLLAPAP